MLINIDLSYLWHMWWRRISSRGCSKLYTCSWFNWKNKLWLWLSWWCSFNTHNNNTNSYENQLKSIREDLISILDISPKGSSITSSTNNTPSKSESTIIVLISLGILVLLLIISLIVFITYMLCRRKGKMIFIFVGIIRQWTII